MPRLKPRLIRRPAAPRRLVMTALATALLATAGVALGASAQATGAQTPPTYTWPKISHDAGNSGFSADPGISTANAAQLGVRWMAGTGAATVSSPVVAWNAELGKTLVYLGNNAGYLTAFDQATGAIVWSVQLGSEIVSTPLVEGNYIWVSRDYSPVLYKIDAATGAIQCSTPLISTSEGSPTIGTPSGGQLSIYIGVNDRGLSSGPIYSIAESNCAVQWQFTDFSTVSGTWDPLSFATDANGRSLILAGSSDPDATVYAIDALTGAKVWSYQTPPQPGVDNPDTDVGAGVAISPPGAQGFADGVAYVPAEDGYFYAFNLTTGAVIWDVYFGTGLPWYHIARATPAIVSGKVVFGESSGVMALSAKTGALKWSFNTNGVEPLSTATALGPAGERVVAVSTTAGAFDVLSVATGKLLYSYQTPSYSTSSIADVDGNLLAASADGFLYDLSIGGGNGTAPTTDTTWPTNGAKVKNPQGAMTIQGTAAGTGIAGVDVAIQYDGSSGPWWDGATGTWTNGFFDNPAVVANPGASSTGWSYNLPVTAAGGSFRVLASSYQTNGLADVTDLTPIPGSTNISFTVLNAPGTAHVYSATGEWVAPGADVTIAGSGFSPGESVTLSLAGSTIGTAVASSTGSLATSAVPIPATATFGPAGVVATGQTSGRSATADIYISNSWNDSGYNAAHTGFEPNDPTLLDAVAPGPPSFLNAVWSDPTGAAVRTSVAIAKDIAYFGNDAGQVSAVDVRNGQPIWTVSEPSVVDSSPALAGSRVFFGINGSSGTGAAVVALNQADGSQAWSAPTSSAVESAPAVANGHVLVGSDDGTVYDLSQTNGTVVWTAHLPGAVTDSPAVDPAAGVVVVGDGSGEVTALSYRTGKVVWQVATGAAVTASPSIFNGTVYIGSGSNNVYALSEATGHQVWVTPTSGAVTSGAIYASFERPNYYAVGCQDGTVWLLGLGDGSVHRVTTVGGPVVGLAASVGWITVTSSNGQLWGLKRNAEPIWKVTAPAPYATAPTLVNGIVYTAGTDQTVTAYSVPGRPIP